MRDMLVHPSGAGVSQRTFGMPRLCKEDVSKRKG